MPYIPPISFTKKQIELIIELTKELGFSRIDSLIRRSLSIFSALVKNSSGPEKNIYLIKAPPEEIKLSYNKAHYILDVNKVKILTIPLLHKYKR